MVNLARSLFDKYPDSILIKYDSEGGLIPSKIFYGEETGDPLSVYVAQHVLHGIGVSVVNLLSITNSEALVFGGGVVRDGILLNKLIEFIGEHCSIPTRKSLGYIGTGRLNANEEGLIGSAWLTWEEAGV